MALEFVTSSPFGGVHGCLENNVNNNFTDLWVHRPHRKPTTPKYKNSNVGRDKDDEKTKDAIGKDEKKQKNKWSRAREMVFSFEKRRHVEDAQSESSVETHSSVGVSSLVRKWKGLEAVAKSGSTTVPDDNVTNEDSLGECESERTVTSGPPSYRSSPSRDFSDGYETDRIRVSDIIKKLTEEQHNAPENAMPRVRTSLDKSEQRCFSPVVNSPRIRGRQAFNDLLLQMDHDRRKELEGLVARKAVSKFPHRGRIQALLRFKFLRQGMETKDDRHSNGASSDQPHKLLQFSDMNCRKRVNSNVHNSSAHIKSCDKDLIDNTPAAEKGKENHHQEVTRLKKYPASNLDNVQDADTKPAKELESINSIFIRISKHIKAKESTCQQVVGTKYDLTGDCAPSQTCQEGKASSEQQLLETCSIWASDVCHIGTEVGWEEENSEYQQEEENDNTDWIYEVSRPRSDWEDLRQERYQEMLYHFMENEEIRTLLGRKTVSNFLSSDLRNQIDRVLLSRTQGQQISVNERTRTEKERVEEVVDEDEKVEVAAEEEKEDKQQYELRENYDDYCDETSTYSSQVASPSPQHSLMSNVYDNRSSTSVAAHPAIEMELMYDLRRHMEQLQQEVVELRKSIRSCVDMQNQLQRSIKQDVKTALNHSDEKKAGGTCSVCCKMPIDSLLYRCGHMCTCLKCAHELQSSSGKCPVCRAPIMDVVRTFYNS